MYSVLIAQHDVPFAERLSAQLRSEGFRVITCPGPWPPQRCIRCDEGYCPLTEGADVMIYDPHLVSRDAQEQPFNLAVGSALAHPDVPMLLAWPPSEMPDAGTLRSIRAQVPEVHLAEQDPSALGRQIESLLRSSTREVRT